MVRAAGVLIVVLAVGACSLQSEEPLLMSTQVRLSDLPVPEGMKLDPDRSHERITPGRRIVYHAYTGGASALSVVKFYKDQLPKSDWQFIDEQMDRGVTTLNYEKEDEQLAVKIFRKDFRTHLILHLYDKD
jgi:hypothetical protein